ncbi:hypothetical protein H7Y21_00935 [Arenimonas sp.]|nr:hypothetical protein [Candidatus Parcubacteria bacterium]
MVTQLGQRPSRMERRDSSEFEKPSRIERVVSLGGNKNPLNSLNKISDVKNTVGNVFKKPLSLNFICMFMVSGTLDIIGVFTTEFPGFSILLSILYNIIFIPWFYFSGIKFNMKKIGSMGATSILEDIPIVEALPWMTINTIYSYYSK